MLQPVLSISCPVDALIYVNGRIAGELGAVTLPVAPEGRQFLQVFPYDSMYAPTTCAIQWHKGRPEIKCESQDVYIVEWPNGYIEMDITPPKTHAISANGLNRAVKHWRQGNDSLIVWQDGTNYAWEAMVDNQPTLKRAVSSADLPSIFSRRMREGWQVAVKGGSADGGEWLQILAFTQGHAEIVLDVSGSAIDTRADGTVKVVHATGDVMGHRMYTVWSPQGKDFVREGSEIEQGDGAPRNVQDAAIAALSALRFGMVEDAIMFFEPNAREEARQTATRLGDFDQAVVLPYPLPNGQTAVGAMRLLSDRHAVVEAINYLGQVDDAGRYVLTALKKA